MDNMNFEITGIFLGVNSHNGIGPQNARIFIRRDDFTEVDGLVPISVYKDLVRGHVYTLNLTKANDPSLTRRTYK